MERYLLDLLAHQEYQLTVINAEQTALTLAAGRQGCDVIHVPMVREPSIMNDLRSIILLRRALRQHRVDVLHLHSTKAGFVGRIAGQLAGVKAIVYTPHGWAFNMFRKGWKRHFYIVLERFLALLCSQITCISEAELEDARKYRIANPRKLTLVVNGIDLERFSPAKTPSREDVLAKLGVGPDVFSVGFVGRLAEQKAPDVVIEAARRVCPVARNVHFFIVGDGPLRPVVEGLIAQYGLQDTVHLLGWRDDVDALLSGFDIGVMPSRWEGFGLSAAEFLAMGKPVVATRVDGLKGVVNDHDTGLLVEPDDPDALARAVLQLMDDRETRDKMGRIGMAVAHERYGFDRVVAEMGQVYTKATL